MSNRAAATYSLHHSITRLIEILPLGDGQCATLRPLLPEDETALQAFVEGLSPATREMRFGAMPAMLVTDIDHHDEMALVATVCEGEGDEERQIVVADARYRLAVDGRGAEFHIVVADAWAGRGIARRMMALLCHCARRAGVRDLRAEVPTANLRMRGLMTSCGFRTKVLRHNPERLAVERRVAAQKELPATSTARHWLAAMLGRVRREPAAARPH